MQGIFLMGINGRMNRLFQYLQANGIRQADFAERCGVTQSVISRLAKGRAQPSPKLAGTIEKETGGAVRFYDWPAYEHFSPSERATS